MTEEILILVKTYPTFSKTYYELVCTAGINKLGEWRRIYPIPFRELKDIEKYRKYQWVKVDIDRNNSDPRPESYKLQPGSDIEIVGPPLRTEGNWQSRKEALKKTLVYTNLKAIIKEANEENSLSLCQFKPNKILGLTVKDDEREWPSTVSEQVRRENSQGILFKDLEREVKLVRKLPYKFSYRFEDDAGQKSNLMIEDWEIGQLYWNCLDKANGNGKEACQKVKEKYEGFISKNDLTLFLGTTRQFHGRARNPFVIIGVFYPPKTSQQELF